MEKVFADLEKRIDDYIEENRESILEDLKRLVRIPSLRGEPEEGAPFGKSIRQCLFLAGQILEGRGFSMETGGNGAFGVCDYGEGEKVVGIFPHLDIVPANEGWTADPFEPFIRGGFIIGRGVSDDKAGAVIAIYCIDALKKLGIDLGYKVRLVFGCNEETGMKDIDAFKEEYPLPEFSLVPDAFFPAGIGEKGRAMAKVSMKRGFRRIRKLEGGAMGGSVVPEYAVCCLSDEESVWREVCQAKEENPMITAVRQNGEIRIESKGIGAHPAMPWDSVNAFSQLMKVLTQVPSLGREESGLCRDIETMVRGCDGSGLGIAFEDGLSTPLTSVCVGAELDDSKRLQMQFNIRYCVTLEEEALKASLREGVEKLGGVIDVLESSPAHYISEDNPYVQAISRAYAAVTGEESACYVHPGGTYAGKLGNAVIFGNEFRRNIPFPEGKGRAHQADEATSIEDLLRGIKIYLYALMELKKEVCGCSPTA